MHLPEVKAAALELVARGNGLGAMAAVAEDFRRDGAVVLRDVLDVSQVELLAVYLGDGCITEHARTHRLLIHLDAKQICAEIEALLKRCFPQNEVSYARPSASSWSGRDDTWHILSVCSSHLACLFPQHGRGKKHERRITLEPWQERIVRSAPWPFIRGCIRTDGCAFINRTDVHREQPYEYLSYDFANMSKDIVDMFVSACDQVGVFTRVTCSRNGRWDVRINRRASVALMLENVRRKT